MPWEILLSISILATVFYTILQKVLMRSEKADSVLFAIVSQILPGIFIFFFALTRGFIMPNFFAYPINTAIMIIAYSFAGLLTFKSLALIDASEFTVLFVTRTLWTVVIAVLFLDEHFSLIQVFGSVCILLSIIFVTWKKKKMSFGKGELFALASGLCFGIGLGNDGFLMRHFDAPSYLVFAFILPGIAIALVYLKKLKKINIFFHGGMFIKMVLLCICFAVSAVTFFLAFQMGNNVGQVSVINQISTVLTVLFSALLLKETTNIKRKILGATVAFLGMILLR